MLAGFFVDAREQHIDCPFQAFPAMVAAMTAVIVWPFFAISETPRRQALSVAT
jgi:hypothetical protein